MNCCFFKTVLILPAQREQQLWRNPRCFGTPAKGQTDDASFWEHCCRPSWQQGLWNRGYLCRKQKKGMWGWFCLHAVTWSRLKSHWSLAELSPSRPWTDWLTRNWNPNTQNVMVSALGIQIWASGRQKSNPGLNIFKFVSSQAENNRRFLQLTTCCSKRRNQWEQLGTDEQRLRVCSTLFRALSS